MRPFERKTKYGKVHLYPQREGEGIRRKRGLHKHVIKELRT